jgi:hypothetical protein
MPKTSDATGATYAGAEGIVEHADGRLSELNPEKGLDEVQPDVAEVQDEHAEEGEQSSHGNSSAASPRKRGSSASKS